MQKNANREPAEKETKNVGPIIGTLTVVIILIAIALYVFASHINRQALINSEMGTSTTIQYTINGNNDPQTLKNDLNNAIK